MSRKSIGKIPLLHYTAMLNEMLLMSDAVGYSIAHLKFMEKFLRLLTKRACHDIPGLSKVMVKHNKKKHANYIAGSLSTHKTAHPLITAYLVGLETGNLAHFTHELKRFNINLKSLSQLQNIRMSSKKLQKIVDELWSDIVGHMKMSHSYEVNKSLLAGVAKSGAEYVVNLAGYVLVGMAGAIIIGSAAWAAPPAFASAATMGIVEGMSYSAAMKAALTYSPLVATGVILGDRVYGQKELKKDQHTMERILDEELD